MLRLSTIRNLRTRTDHSRVARRAVFACAVFVLGLTIVSLSADRSLANSAASAASSTTPTTFTIAASAASANPAAEVASNGHIFNFFSPLVTPTPTCERAWGLDASPNSGSSPNYLSGVAAVSSTEYWAVGTAGNSPLIEHFTAGQWNIVASPPVTESAFLAAVAAVSPTDVWAVGFSTLGQRRYTLTMHWNGARWSIIPSPAGGQSFLSSYLTGVAALGPDDVWAVGYFTNTDVGAYYPNTLVLHWDGIQWSVVPSPNGSNDPTHNNYLQGIAAISPTDIWAVGYYNATLLGYSYATLALHWDGTAWTWVSTPNRSGFYFNYLYAVSAVSSNDIWAVGSYKEDASSTNNHTLVMHWNGSAWQLSYPPNRSPYPNELMGVAAIGASNVWAVGYSGAGSARQTLAEHFDGSAWTIFPSPNPSGNGSSLAGVDAAPNGTLKAVGSYTASTEATLVIHYPGETCAFPPTPTVIPTPSQTPTPEASPTPCGPGVYADVPPGSTFYPFVTCLATRGIVGGYSDCTFRPGNNITRGQIAKMVSNAADFNDTIPPTQQTYADVPYTNTFWLWIERLTLHNVMSGYQCGGAGEPCDAEQRPYFRWAANATRGQLSKIVSNAADFAEAVPSDLQTFEDVPHTNTFWLWIERLAERGVMGGYSCGTPPAGQCVPPGNRAYFLPFNNVTRGQASKIVANTFYPNCQTPSANEGK